jgi:hypothetical protein
MIISKAPISVANLVIAIILLALTIHFYELLIVTHASFFFNELAILWQTIFLQQPAHL